MQPVGLQCSLSYLLIPKRPVGKVDLQSIANGIFNAGKETGFYC